MGPNRPGRGAHIATASFMVDPTTRSRGVGRALGEHMLAWAEEQGYRGVQFNAVVETNHSAVHLWQSLGFEIIGTVPEAFHHAESGYVGLHSMFRRLPGTGSTPRRWSASSVYPDMWADPDKDPRDSGVELTDERSTLLEYLRAYRLTLEMKCADLDAEQLARRSVSPSTMSLLGLLRHLADVERHWFRRIMAGDDAPKYYPGEQEQWEGAVADTEVVEEAWRLWRDEVGYADALVADSDLERRGTLMNGQTLQLREVLVHMIEEYARHCGHADLIRERVDGRVGQ
jgi:uncharacterized damage-inducible protein DinB